MKIKESLKQDFSVEDNDFYKTMLFCCFVAATLFVSFFFAPFVYVSLALSAFLIIYVKGIKKIYVLMFLLPFYNVFRYNKTDLVFCSYLLLLTILLVGIEYIIDLCKKRKKIEVKTLIPVILLAIFFMIPYGNFSILSALRLECTVAICYLCYIYKDNLNLKQLLYSLIIGLLLASFFAVFRDVSPRLNSFLSNTKGGGESYRFSGLASGPNYFSVEVILVLSLLSQMYFNKKINILYFVLFFVFSVLGLLTLSKAYILVYLFLFIIVVVLLIKEHRKSKKFYLYGTFGLFIMLLFILVFYKQINILIRRFIFGENMGINGGVDGVLDKITTGRFSLWGIYLNRVFSSVLTAFFGFGNNDFGVITKYGYQAVHNAYIEAMYAFGLIGFLLIVGVFVYFYIITRSKRKKLLINYISLIMVMFILFGLNSVISYRPYLLIIILSYSLSFDKKDVEYINDDILNKTEVVKEKLTVNKLSVIIPIYNVESYLERCVESIVKQDIKDTEILLIDDGSTDNSWKISDNIARKYESVTCYHKKNGGLSDARNYGIKKAKGDYLIFIDSDDYVNNNFMKLYPYLEKNTDLILFGMEAEYLNKTKTIKYDKNKDVLNKDEIIENCLEVCTKKNSACMKAVKRELIINNKLFFENGYTEDFNWFGRIIGYVNSATITDLVYYHYIAEREGSIMNTFKKSKFYDVINHAKSIMKEIEKLNLNKKDLKRIKQYIGFNILSNFRHIKTLNEEDQEEVIKLLNSNYELIKHQKALVMKLFLSVAKIIGFKKAYKII